MESSQLSTEHPQLAVPLQDLALLRNLRDSILAGTHPLFRVPARLYALPYKVHTATPPREQGALSVPASAAPEIEAGTGTGRLDDGTLGDRVTAASKTVVPTHHGQSSDEEEGELVANAPLAEAESVPVTTVEAGTSDAGADVSTSQVGGKAPIEVLVLDNDDDDDDDDDGGEVKAAAEQDAELQTPVQDVSSARGEAADCESLPDYVDSSDDEEDDFDPSILIRTRPSGPSATSAAIAPRHANVEELVLDDDENCEDQGVSRPDHASAPPPLSAIRSPSPSDVHRRFATLPVTTTGGAPSSSVPTPVVANGPQVPPAQRHATALSLRLKLERERLAAAEARLAAARAASGATTPVPASASSSRANSPAPTTTTASTTTAAAAVVETKVAAVVEEAGRAMDFEPPAVADAVVVRSAPPLSPGPPAPAPTAADVPNQASDVDMPAPAPSSDAVVDEVTAPGPTREDPRSTPTAGGAASPAPPTDPAGSRSEGQQNIRPAVPTGKRGRPGPAQSARDEPPKRQRGGSDHRNGPPVRGRSRTPPPPPPPPPSSLLLRPHLLDGGPARGPPTRLSDGRGAPRALESAGGDPYHRRRYSHDGDEDFYRPYGDRGRGRSRSPPPPRSAPFGRPYSPPLPAYGRDQRRPGRYSVSPPPPPAAAPGPGHFPEFRQYTGVLPSQDRRDPRYRRSLSPPPPPPPMHAAPLQSRPPLGFVDEFSGHAYPRFDLPRPDYQRYDGLPPHAAPPPDFDRPRSPLPPPLPLFDRIPPPLPQQATSRGPPASLPSYAQPLYDPRSRPVSPVLPPPGFRRPPSPLYDERRLPLRQSYDDDHRRDRDQDRRFDLPPPRSNSGVMPPTYLPGHFAPPPPPGYPPVYGEPPAPADYERFRYREGAEHYLPRPPVSASRGAMPPPPPFSMTGRPPLPGSQR